MQDVSPFGIAQKAIQDAKGLRLSPPQRGEKRDAGTDLQARFVNWVGAGYWLTVVTFPESPGFRSWVRPEPQMPPFPGGFGMGFDGYR